MVEHQLVFECHKFCKFTTNFPNTKFLSSGLKKQCIQLDDHQKSICESTYVLVPRALYIYDVEVGLKVIRTKPQFAIQIYSPSIIAVNKPCGLLFSNNRCVMCVVSFDSSSCTIIQLSPRVIFIQ